MKDDVGTTTAKVYCSSFKFYLTVKRDKKSQSLISGTSEFTIEHTQIYITNQNV